MSAVRDRWDVAVLGGGLAGLTLAIQLQRARPSLRVLVLDKQTHPVAEVTHKVGESFVELGSWYLREVIGLGDHLLDDQLPKFGLRFFMTAGDNTDIARRAEFGPLRTAPFALTLPFRGLPLPTYNVDRGRLENHLARRAVELGAQVDDGAKITAVDLGADHHEIGVDRGADRFRVRARWVIDASGRAGLLKRRLELAQRTDHDIDARWFRLAKPIDPDDWSADTEWRSRTLPGLRRLSTNHLMGPGYWVWMIPLASGGTSVGVVTDPAVHDTAQLNRFDRVLAWLHRHEPQCADAVAEQRDDLHDFKIMNGGAYGCRRVFSAERWALTGEAAIHLDPLYSPGGDLIAVTNTLITQLVCEELDGESIAGAVHFSETLLQSMFEHYLQLYRGQYSVLGNAQVMTAKVCWDTAVYFAYNTLLFQNARLCDRRFLLRARAQIETLSRLQGRVQAAFPAWAAREAPSVDGAYVDQLAVGFMRDFYMSSKPPYTDGELHARLSENMRVLEDVAQQLLRRAGAGSARTARAPAPGVAADVRQLWS